MNIAEILKNCPEGTKLYSLLFGEVELICADNRDAYPIRVERHGCVYKFTSEGKYFNSQPDGECVLFPSRDNRDWSTFNTLKKKYNFKPFDKVLVRDDISDRWCCNIFSNPHDSEDWKYECITDMFRYCIPYEGNEHLLGTTDNPD